MTMQINIDVQLSLGYMLMKNGSFHSVDSWVINWVRLTVHPVQVETLGVVAPVASFHTIRIEQGYNFEDETREEYACLRTISSQ